jgi:hypothetical protein
MQGSLHCAAHDETVSCFGRDDDFLGFGKREQGTAEAKSKADPFRMTPKKDEGKAPATADFSAAHLTMRQ